MLHSQRDTPDKTETERHTPLARGLMSNRTNLANEVLSPQTETHAHTHTHKPKHRDIQPKLSVCLSVILFNCTSKGKPPVIQTKVAFMSQSSEKGKRLTSLNPKRRVTT